MRIIRREIEKKYKNSDLIKKLSQEKQYFIRRYLDLSKVKALLIGVCKYTSNRCCDLPLCAYDVEAVKCRIKYIGIRYYNLWT